MTIVERAGRSYIPQVAELISRGFQSRTIREYHANSTAVDKQLADGQWVWLFNGSPCGARQKWSTCARQEWPPRSWRAPTGPVATRQVSRTGPTDSGHLASRSCARARDRSRRGTGAQPPRGGPLLVSRLGSFLASAEGEGELRACSVRLCSSLALRESLRRLITLARAACGTSSQVIMANGQMRKGSRLLLQPFRGPSTSRPRPRLLSHLPAGWWKVLVRNDPGLRMEYGLPGGSCAPVWRWQPRAAEHREPVRSAQGGLWRAAGVRGS